MQDNHPSPIPADAHVPPPSTHVRTPKPRLRLEDLFPLCAPLPRRRRVAICCIAVLAVVAGLFLWGAERISHPAGDGGQSAGSPAQTLDRSDTDPQGEIPPSTEEPDHTAPSVAPDPQDTDPPSDTEDPAVTEEAPAQTESTVSVPDGCISFVTTDMSQIGSGPRYVESNGTFLPSSLPSDSPWRVDTPAVLIINTHPYEGYGGDAPWYDPSSGGLALTDSPSDPDGVVALGAALTRALRERGITVIHLRISVSPSDSTSAICERTEEAIRYYCSLYPDIGLIMDLRRSAELTADGGILATQGDCNGIPCAQPRISVSGGRGGTASDYDLAVALDIREALWNVSPTLSRPVRVKNGAGTAGDLTDLRVLTLELGSAGNTYAEALASVEPIGDAIAATVKKYS